MINSHYIGFGIRDIRFKGNSRTFKMARSNCGFRLLYPVTSLLMSTSPRHVCPKLNEFSACTTSVEIALCRQELKDKGPVLDAFTDRNCTRARPWRYWVYGSQRDADARVILRRYQSIYNECCAGAGTPPRDVCWSWIRQSIPGQERM